MPAKGAVEERKTVQGIATTEGEKNGDKRQGEVEERKTVQGIATDPLPDFGAVNAQDHLLKSERPFRELRPERWR